MTFSRREYACTADKAMTVKTLQANDRLRAALAARAGSLPLKPKPTLKPALKSVPAPIAPAKTVPPELNEIEMAGRARSADITATRRALLNRWPNCFKGYMRPKKPLKIGIDKDILAADPELNPEIVKLVLRIYVSHETYREVMIEGAGRVDLDGNPAGVVTKSQAEWSAMKLKRKVENTTKATLAEISAT
jgi:ProP effector